MAEGEAVVRDREPIAGSGPDGEGDLMDVQELLRALDANDLDTTVPRDLSAFTQTQKILLRAELTTMIAAEDALDVKLTAAAVSAPLWRRACDMIPGLGRRDFMKKDGQAGAHRARVRYFKDLLGQLGN